MVAIFTGAGAGFERGSSSVLGGAGLLGQASLGRNGEQLFLNAATGNLLISQRDEFLVGRGPDAAVSRTYNSLGDMSDENGDNWRQSTDRRVHGLNGTVKTAGSTVKRVSADGSEILYTWDMDKAAYVAIDGAGAYDTLAYSGGIWTWTDGSSRMRETYAAYEDYWRISKQVDTDGNALTFTYTEDKLTKVTTDDGGTVDYVWSGSKITQIVTGYTDLSTSTARTQTRTRYAYDAYYRLKTVTVDLSPEDNSVNDGKTYVTTYTYDGTSKRVASISQTDGSRMDIVYDASGRVVSLAETIATDVTRLTTIAYEADSTTITDPAGQVTTLDYSVGKKFLQKIITPPAYAGASAQVVRFSYTSNGDLETVTDALGNITSYGYDGMGNVVSQTDRLGSVVTRTYGAKNELLTETRTGSNVGAAAAQHTTRYAYDTDNHLRYVVSADGHVTEFFYTAAGELRFTTEYPEHAYDLSGIAANTPLTEAGLDAWRDALADRSSAKVSYNVYDARGNLTASLNYGTATTAGLGSLAEGYNRIYFTYDQAGRLLSRHAQGQNAETFVYDGMGRLVASTDVNGGTTNIVFTDSTTKTVVTLANGFVQTSTYNKAGDLVSFTESGSYVAGGTASYEYDDRGQLRMATDATGFNSYYVYDKTGRKIADVNHYGDVVEYGYDANDRLVATARYTNRLDAAQLATLADPNSNIEMASLRPTAHSDDIRIWQVYDKEGHLIEAIDGNGSVTAYQYDRSDRLIKTTAYANKLTAAQVSGFKTAAPSAPVLPAADADKDRVARNFYDKDGRLVGGLDGEGYLSRIVYDEAGQKIEEVAFLNAAAAAYRAAGTFSQLLGSVAAHANDRHVRYVYNGQGLRYQIDGLDQVTEFGYNLAGQLTQTIRYAGSIAATTDYTYDNVKALVAASGLASHAATRKSWSVYDAAGRIAYSIDPEGAVTGFSYGSTGQVVKTVQYAVERVTSSLPLAATMDTWAAAQEANTANRVTRNYFSARGDLRFIVDAEGYITRNDHDAEGRITRTIRWELPVVVNDTATIAAVQGLAAGTWVDIRYDYDAAGRLSNVNDGKSNRHLIYSANGTLAYEIAAYGHADEARTHYVYDDAGRVTAEYRAYGTDDQIDTRYGYDGLGNLVSITDPKNNVTTRAYDRLGRMVGQTDALGGEVSYEYDAFDEAVKVTDARGYASYNHYDKLGRLIFTRDAENYVTETAYTVFGDVESVTRYYTKASNAASVTTLPTCPTHEKDAATRFEYDRLGRLIKTIDAEGYYEQYTLDAFGQRISVRNKLGGVTANAYDRRGLLLSEKLPMASVRSDGTTQASAVTNRFEYDMRGNRTKKIEADGLTEQRTTTYIYDKANRLIETQGEAIMVLDQSDHRTLISAIPTERIAYDKRGNVIEVDSNGARTLFYYDLLDRKIAEVNAVGTLTTYNYTKNGNIASSRVYETRIVPLPAAGGEPPQLAGNAYRATTHTYDALGRLKTTSVADVRTGAWDGSAYETSATTLTTRYDYDANGNVIKVTDADGGTTFSYYDKLGRKTAEVDQEKYLTTWTRDGEGNVLTERRYATEAASVTTASQPSVAVHGDDRVTRFTYDRNGRRLTEERSGVVAWSVGTNGALAAASSIVTINYDYNGLGQVKKKTEANGDSVDYTYDSAGRLTMESRAPFNDYVAGNPAVRPTVRYSYDGLNNLTLTRQGGATVAAGDRMTRYSYAAGGRLKTMTDAGGAAFTYFHDVAGNVVRQGYWREQSDGTGTWESIFYSYDAMGRVTAQRLATWSGGTWVEGDTQDTAYNAYGEVEQRGINGLWQEQFAYDNAGRLFRTNSGDGVWRYFVYDANGNRTLTLESEGTNLADKAIDDALAVATANGAHNVGSAYVDGINVTIAVFDKRGQQTATRQPFRQLTAANRQTLTNARTYNAFGEVTSETDARGYTTDFSYNEMGRLIEKKSPTVSHTNESGVTASVRPVETYYYDVSGRMVGVRDANGNVTSRTLLAGTGHGGAEALVTAEYHEDGGIFRTYYDLFGDARILRDELDQDETRVYDAMSRLIQQTHRGGLTDHYAYDLLGQRIEHWNSHLGGDVVETTDYDAQGRVTRHVAFGGDVTGTSYAWDGALATAGMGTFGGWTETTTYANGKTLIEKTDLFGRDVYKKDLGGRVSTFSYDLAGRMTRRSGGETLNYAYFNTGRVAEASTTTGSSGTNNWSSISSTYEYDSNGNLLSEITVDEGGEQYVFKYASGPEEIGERDYSNNWYRETQNAKASYDALGRLTSWTEAGSTATPAAQIQYSYDLNGNIRRSQATYRSLDQNGAASGTVSKDHWYRYDKMNRVVTDKGILSNGSIVRGEEGADHAYDAAGRRVHSIRTVRTITDGPDFDPDPNPYPDNRFDQTASFNGLSIEEERHEKFTYDAAGNLLNVRIGLDASMTGALKASYTYDGMERLTRQIDWLGDGTDAAYDRQIVYDAKGQIGSETVSTKQGSDTLVSYIVNQYGSGTSYALGAVVSSVSDNWKNGSDSGMADTSTANSFGWWDGAVTTQVSFDGDTGTTSNTVFHTTYAYNGAGHLQSAQINDGRRRTVTYASDVNGQVIRRDEADSNSSAGDPHEIWYRFGGKQLGYTGNNGTLDTGYQASISNRTKTPGTGAFRFGASAGSAYADFDQSLDAINSYGQGGAGGGHVVRAGDGLASIAAQLWGDASLWYKLAEANGLSAASALTEGQRLTIPAGVMKNTHNAATFTPYDPAKALGDTSPTAPQPQAAAKKNKCGVFGAVLVAVIGAVVSFLLPPIAPGLGSIISGALTAATANVITQGIAVATGLQDKFSWKGVAFAAVGSGVDGGLGSIGGKFGKFLDADTFISNVAKGALGNGITQGVAIITGLQKKFDWAGVAAAGATAGVSGLVRRALPGQAKAVYEGEGGAILERRYQTFGNALASNAAGAIAEAASRSLVSGTSFGDNLIASLPSAIGQTIGNSLAQEFFGAEDRVIVTAEQRRAATERLAQNNRLAGGGGGHPLLMAASYRSTTINAGTILSPTAAFDSWVLNFASAVAAAGELSLAQQATAGLSPAKDKVAALMADLTNPATRAQYIVERKGVPNEIQNIALTGEEYLLAVDAGIWRLLQGVLPSSSSAPTGPSVSFGQDSQQIPKVEEELDRARAFWDPLIKSGQVAPNIEGDANIRTLVGAIARRTYFADLADIPGYSWNDKTPNKNSFEHIVHVSRRDGELLITKLLTSGPTGGSLGSIASDVVAIVHTHPAAVALHTPGIGDPAIVWQQNGIPNFIVARQVNTGSLRRNGLGALRTTEIGRINNQTVWRSINQNGNAEDSFVHPWQGWR